MAAAVSQTAEHEEGVHLLGDKYRLISKIGRGGMGDVWVARNNTTEAEVAIKTLTKAGRSHISEERLRREAKLASNVHHRNIVRIFDLVDGEDGVLGLVMELLRGNTLEACLKTRGPFSTVETIAIAVPILSALHHVHQKGIVHRDMKPGNVFFAIEPDGLLIPKVLDFGIAKVPAAGSALTLDGSVLGTPHYMSPEQIRGQEDIDGRSDMFSFAVVLYEMLTGERVFHRESAAGSLAAVLEYDVDPDPRIEPRVWLALQRALAKRAYERHANCLELAEALRAAVDATDEELAMALLDLRPTVEVGQETLGATYEMAASGTPRKKKASGNNLVWVLVAAASAAVIAVTATLAITRRTYVDPNPRVEASAASTPSTTSTTTTTTTTAPVESAAPRDPAPAITVVTTSAPPPPAAKPRPTAKPTSTGTGKKRDLATKPDF